MAKKHGGKRPNSGRKSKAFEQNLNGLLEKCVPGSQRESIIQKLAEDAGHTSFRIRNEARKLLLAYMYGKPVERHEVDAQVDVNLPSAEDLKKKFEERRQTVEALDD
jgi:hypothetical protein